jgi:hypothetical protein
MIRSLRTPRILDDGTEVPDDDEFPMPGAPIEDAGRWSALYSLEECDEGYAIVTFDRYGRTVRPHPLESGLYESPGAAFEAIRRFEAGAFLKPARESGIRPIERVWLEPAGSDALATEPEEQSA